MRIAFFALLAVVLGLAVAATQAVTYTGSLTSMGGGLTGTGVWNTNSSGLPTTMSWVVDDTTTAGMWHYSYNLTVPLINHPKDEFRFMYIETVPGASSGDFVNFAIGPETPNLVFAGVGVKKKTGIMPGSMTALSLVQDEDQDIIEGGQEGHIVAVSFDTARAPQWGDFFADGFSTNQIRDVGFTAKDVDPTVPPSDGSVAANILVPGQLSTPTPPTPPGPPQVIPEPITMLLVTLSVLPLGIKLRRRLVPARA